MFRYNFRSPRGRRRGGWGFLPIIILFFFVGSFMFHHAVGFLFAIVPFLFLFWIIRSMIRRAGSSSMWNNQMPYYQPPQQQPPYYQPQQPEGPYYQPQQTQSPYYQPYQQGYQSSQPPAQPEVYQEGGQQHRYEQYEQPQAEYPQELPPMEQ